MSARNSIMLVVRSLVSKTKKDAVLREMQIFFAKCQCSGGAAIAFGSKHTKRDNSRGSPSPLQPQCDGALIRGALLTGRGRAARRANLLCLVLRIALRVV